MKNPEDRPGQPGRVIGGDSVLTTDATDDRRAQPGTVDPATLAAPGCPGDLGDPDEPSDLARRTDRGKGMARSPASDIQDRLMEELYNPDYEKEYGMKGLFTAEDKAMMKGVIRDNLRNARRG